MVNKLLLMLLFILSFLFVDRYFKKRDAEKFKRKNNQLVISNDDYFKKVLKKFLFLKSKDEFLSKQGYPLKLNAVTYYSVKLILVILFVISSKNNYDSFLATLFFGVIAYFILDLFILIRKQSRDYEICYDLLNVCNSISLQLSANIMLKDSLKRQFEICKNQDFKQAMLKFSTKYELSELDLDTALKELNQSFQIPEVEMFCNSLSQYTSVGNIITILDSLAEALKEKYYKKIRDGTRNKILYITIGVMIALGNMILLTFYPLFVSIENGLSNIFN